MGLLLLSRYVQQLRDGVNNFYAVFLQVLEPGGTAVEDVHRLLIHLEAARRGIRRPAGRGPLESRYAAS